jgi:hypothetical protein
MATVNRSTTALNPNRRRYTKKQIQQRRVGVWEMLCCGQDVDKIANHYGVSVKTIERDQKWWEERLGYQTQQLKDPANAAIDVGMTAAKLQKIAEDAYVEYLSSNNPVVKDRFLNTSMRALGMRHKIQADAGYLPKVGHEQEEGFQAKITFEARFGKEAPQAVFDNHHSRRKVLEAVAAAMRLGVGADGLPMPDTNEGIVIDAEEA